jgi:hypothetical protein
LNGEVKWLKRNYWTYRTHQNEGIVKKQELTDCMKKE